MNNKDALTTQIEKIIDTEKKSNNDIQFLSSHHAPLIKQIISNYELSASKEAIPSAELIFVAAPTGAGKETLIQKITHDNPDKNYIILNMDIFRHYHNEIINSNKPILDINFAKETNQTSYELYYIIQEIILREFPGTNIIVTGTMKDLSWVKSIIERYKNNSKTNYQISLATLAVPNNESAFSIFERYLYMVKTRNGSTTPLRYTSLDYHNKTIQNFVSHIHYFEDNMHYNDSNRYFNFIQVYRRISKIGDYSEDTLVYDSRNPNNNRPAHMCIQDIMFDTSKPISSERISSLLEIIKENSDYLKQQKLYESILLDLKKILSPQFPSKNDIEPLI